MNLFSLAISIYSATLVLHQLTNAFAVLSNRFTRLVAVQFACSTENAAQCNFVIPPSFSCISSRWIYNACQWNHVMELLISGLFNNTAFLEPRIYTVQILETIF